MPQRLFLQVSQQEPDVGRPFGQPAHEVAVPVFAVGQVDADPVPLPQQPFLQIMADAVEQLESYNFV